jgi:hypothetical protein
MMEQAVPATIYSVAMEVHALGQGGFDELTRSGFYRYTITFG